MKSLYLRGSRSFGRKLLSSGKEKADLKLKSKSKVITKVIELVVEVAKITLNQIIQTVKQIV